MDHCLATNLSGGKRLLSEDSLGDVMLSLWLCRDMAYVVLVCEDVNNMLRFVIVSLLKGRCFSPLLLFIIKNRGSSFEFLLAPG